MVPRNHMEIDRGRLLLQLLQRELTGRKAGRAQESTARRDVVRYSDGRGSRPQGKR